MNLTDRQIQLLEAIIKEYLDTAEPVGSTLVVQKYNIKCSPATVRNEMALLIKQGFLQMAHTSSGRIPTTYAYKFFLDELMTEESLDVLEEIALKQRLWAKRHEFEKMLRQAILALSDITHEMAFATTEDGHVMHAGAANLLHHKEFEDASSAISVLNIVDRYESLERVLNLIPNFEDADVKCIIGEDLSNTGLTEAAAVVSHYSIGKRSGFIGVLGPARLKYYKVIPAVRYAKNLVEELGGSW